MNFSKNYSNYIINLGYHAFLNCLNSNKSQVFNYVRTIKYEIYIFLDYKEFLIVNNNEAKKLLLFFIQIVV